MGNNQFYWSGLNKIEKIKHENFNFVHLPSLISITQKLYGAYEYYTYQMTALLPGIFLFWVGVSHEWATASKPSSRTPRSLACRLLGLLLTYFRSGMYSQAIPWLLNKQKFDYSFHYLLGLEDQFSATEDTVVHVETFWIPAPQHYSASFGGK